MQPTINALIVRGSILCLFFLLDARAPFGAGPRNADRYADEEDIVLLVLSVFEESLLMLGGLRVPEVELSMYRITDWDCTSKGSLASSYSRNLSSSIISCLILLFI